MTTLSSVSKILIIGRKWDTLLESQGTTTVSGIVDKQIEYIEYFDSDE